MATLQQQIVEKFLSRLSESQEVDAGTLAELRKLLATGKKPRPDDLVAAFTVPPGGDLK